MPAVPFASSPAVSPVTLDLRSLTPVNGRYPVSLTARVTVRPPAGGDTRTYRVQTELLGPQARDVLADATLRDDGTGPDSVAGDARFAGTLTFTATRSDAGLYRLRFRARSDAGVESNSVEAAFLLTRNNSAPVLSQLSAPDTVSLPAGGSLLIPMTVAAQDSDGIEDIRHVYFRSLDSSDPDQQFFLLDDGGINSNSGDETAGDGVFSVIVQLTDSPTVRRTFRLAFQASDAFGDTSATLLHFLTVQ